MIQHIDKLPVRNIMTIILAYVCGGIMCTVYFNPQLKALESKINHTDSMMQTMVPIRIANQRYRELTTADMDTIKLDLSILLKQKHP